MPLFAVRGAKQIVQGGLQVAKRELETLIPQAAGDAVAAVQGQFGVRPHQ